MSFRAICAAALLVVASLLIGPRSARAASARQIPMAEFVEEVWEARDGGLPHPTVSTFLRARDGYLWIGTGTGLARFDGRQFYVPHRDRAPELATPIRSLAEGEDGSLWIATRRSGLFRLKGGVVESFTKAVGLSTAVDLRALALQGHTLWIAAGVDLVAWDLSSGTARRFGEADGLANTAVTALYVDPKGTLWVLASGTLLARWDGTRFVATPIALGALPNREVQSSGIAQDAAGDLWVAAEPGLVKVEAPSSAAPRSTLVVDARCRSVFASASGIWAGCLAGLVHIQDGRVRTYGPSDGFDQEWLDQIHEDAEGSIWVASRTGLLRLRPRVIQTYTRRDDGSRFGATDCVLETRDGDLWVCTSDGLSRRHNGRWTLYDMRHGLPSISVRSLAEGTDGALWVATSVGVSRFENGRVTASYPSPAKRAVVRAVTVDAEGRPWFGTPEAMVYRIENGAVVAAGERRTDCVNGTPSHIRFAADGTLALGNEDGLVLLRDGKLSSCSADPSTIRNDIRHILEDERGRLWIGSIGGVSLWDKGSLSAVAGDGGPFDTSSYAILDDGRGAFWFSTGKGVFRVLKSNLEQGVAQATTPIFRYFGMEDGMETSVCIGTGQPSGWRGRDGRLYFTTANGIAIVDPSRIQASAQVPPVYIDGLSADQKAVDIAARSVVLPPGTRSLQIDFTAVNFVAPEMVQCRYRLEGFDPGWVLSGSRRTAYYTNLAPGHYRFRASAANPDGAWNERGAVLEFDLAPYFYQRQGFIALCVALGVAAVTMAYRLRIARLRANEIELKRRVDDALAQAKTLRGLLPICASCKKIRDDTGYWNQMETYIHEHSGADFSHSVCPDCLVKLYPEYVAHQEEN